MKFFVCPPEKVLLPATSLHFVFSFSFISLFFSFIYIILYDYVASKYKKQ